ncbi:hypothetical protein [Pseudoalteromonas espejiana]|uniref:DUF4234 domain-containing protein n=1 Tax=Pseudoalteromonas espejiana TaxID=28107 RepID=A0A510XSA8_9GAMM|nr:hypothetical protein [Pseudoalteromonas espejiana]GEK53902.1 hypothetical protein PES01_07470 [Pseudoalteromonas espejiana]
MKKELTDIFEVDSVLKTLVLCVLTIGSYLIYKLYRFSNQINKHTELKISKYFILTTVILFGISLASLIYGLVNIHDLSILKSSIVIHLVSSVFDVTWIVMVRNRINQISGSSKGDILWLNPFITSIFHVIYMQHKINQSLVKTAI